MDIPDFERLNREKRKIPDKYEPLRLRAHRIISWGRRADQEMEDLDARFIFLWIGLNAAYSKDPDAAAAGRNDKKNLEELRSYLNILVSLDSRLVHNVFWKGSVFQASLSLLEDEYLYNPFWKSRTPRDKHKNWRTQWEADKSEFVQAQFFSDTQKKHDVPKLLSDTVFKRLSVLRNQLVHGSATWKSKHTRKALRRGVRVLERTLPVFVDLMIKNPHSKKWGTPRYLPDK